MAKKLGRAAVVIVLFLAASVISATSASASTTVSGTVTCANDYVSGVWIEAESSTSGWAAWEMPFVLGGHSQADYSFPLDRGGRYQVHVGCGGSSADWKVNAKSVYVAGTENDFFCNDVPPWLQFVGSFAFRVAKLALLGSGLRDLPPYQTCEIV